MGLFRRDKKVQWQYGMMPGEIEVEAVGEKSYQPALEALCGGKWTEPHGCHDLPVRAWLRREPENKYDSNAVQVRVGEAIVGYLSRADAEAFQPMLRALEADHIVGCCDAHIRGGWDRGDGDTGYFGIFLSMPEARADVKIAVS